MQPAGPTGSLPFFWMGICRGPDDGDSKTGQGQTASSEKYADFSRYRNYGLSPSHPQDTAYISRPPSRKSHACKRPGGYFSGPFPYICPVPRLSSANHPRRHTAFIIAHCGAVQKRERERERERKKERKNASYDYSRLLIGQRKTGTAWYKYLTSRFTHSAHHSLPRHRGGHGQNVPNPQHSCLRP